MSRFFVFLMSLFIHVSLSHADEAIDNFEFDEDMFDIPSDQHQPVELMESILDHFTFKLDHQLYAQVNDHASSSNTSTRSRQTIENNRFNLLIKHQTPLANSWLIQGSSQVKIFLPTDYEYGKNNDPGVTEFRVGDFMEFRLNELFIQKSLTHDSVKLGRQTLVWGEVQSNSVLDVINTREFRDLSVVEIEDARLNQAMLVWEHYAESFNTTTFFNFYPEFNPQPRQGSPLFIKGHHVLHEPTRNRFIFETGSQIKWTLGASDVSLMAAYLYENPLHFKNDLIDPEKANTIINDYLMVGMATNYAIRKLLLKLDVVYNHGIIADTYVSPHTYSCIKNNQVGVSLGFEYAISHEQQISSSIAARYFLNQSDHLSENEQLINQGIVDRWRLLYTHQLFNNELTYSFLTIGSINQENVLASMALDYSVDDHWSVMAQVISTWASKKSSSALLDEELRFGFNTQYSF